MFGLGKSKLAYHEPKNTVSDGECDPLFFKPDDHKKHMEHMDLTDKSYLDHMVPHHQVAVDMCKRLLLHTKSTHMMALCYDIIYGQQAEILQMNQLKDNMAEWKYNTNFLDRYINFFYTQSFLNFGHPMSCPSVICFCL